MFRGGFWLLSYPITGDRLLTILKVMYEPLVKKKAKITKRGYLVIAKDPLDRSRL